MTLDGLDRVIDKIEEVSGPLQKIDQIVGAAGIAIGVYGEMLQGAVRDGLMEYNWWVGHLGDITGPAGLALFIGPLFSNKISRAQTAGYMAGFYTFTEVTGILETSPTDPQDIACYWGGAVLGIGICKGIDKLRDLFNIYPISREEEK